MRYAIIDQVVPGAIANVLAVVTTSGDPPAVQPGQGLVCDPPAGAEDGWVFVGGQFLPAVVNPVPDNPTLSDWRVGLTLWGRIDDVTARVAALIASTDPATAMLGKVAKERLEYANNVLRAQLLTLKDAVGFTEADVDESLWRANRVTLGDLSGVWPLA